MTDPRDPVPTGTPKVGEPAVCLECEARHRGICGVLSVDELATLNQISVRKVYPKGSTLIEMGHVPEFHGNVLQGVVKLSKTLQDGRQQIVGIQFAPDFLGRVWGEESPVGAESATEVHVCRFPRDVIEHMMSTIHRLEHRVFEQILLQLDLARDWILTLGQKSATERVASLLLLIAKHNDPTHNLESRSHNSTFELPLSRADIADFLGLTLETVSRQVTKLRDLGVIRVENNRTITVLDQARLVELSGP
ncbi:MAG: Crp/Fnr family transcriptional regulator [Hyphomicrobiaceae bacterium]|nr:Crp/Fnr family transcriptional regulator [Hyphomicrobiaceae bacterium]